MDEDLNDEDLNGLNAQYTKTVFDEEKVCDRITNLSQEDLYECDIDDDDGTMGMGLAKRDIDDADDIDDDMADIQDNPVYKAKDAKRQKLMRLDSNPCNRHPGTS